MYRTLGRFRALTFVAGVVGTIVGCANPPRIVTARMPATPAPDDYVGELWQVDAHDKETRFVKFSPDSRKLITGGDDGYARIWDVESGELTCELGKHGSIVWQSPVLQVLLGIIPPWDLYGNSLVRSLLTKPGDVYDADFSPDGTRVLTCSIDGTTRLWDASTSRQIWRADGGSHEVAFSRDGRRAVSTSMEMAYLFDAASGKLIAKHQWTPLVSLAYSSDGKRVIATNGGGGMNDETGSRFWSPATRIFDPNSGNQIDQYSTMGEVSADGRLLGTRDDDSITVWGLQSGAKLREISVGRGSGLELASNCERLLCGVKSAQTWDDLVLFNWRSGREVYRLPPFERWIPHFDISPDGRYAATVGVAPNGLVRVWQFPPMRSIDQVKSPTVDSPTEHLPERSDNLSHHATHQNPTTAQEAVSPP